MAQFLLFTEGMKRWGSLILFVAAIVAAEPAFASARAKPAATPLQWAARMFGGFFGGFFPHAHEPTASVAESKASRVATPKAPDKSATAPVPARTTYLAPKPIVYRGQSVVLTIADGSERTYRLGKELGQGKWSVTHEGLDTSSGERVAIKLTKPTRLDLGHIDTFREEAESLGKLNHPNVMTTRGVGKLEGTTQRALVMDYVPGQTVGQRFWGRAKTPRGEAIEIAMKIIEGAEAMHAAGMVHKSLHVGNVMYEPGEANGKGSVKIIDLGGSKAISSKYTPQRDWNDIGTLLAFMLTGEKGYQGGQWPDLDAALRVLPDITVKHQRKELHLKDVILKATHEDPAQGFSGGEAFRNALKPFLKTERWQIKPRAAEKAARAQSEDE